MKKWLLLGAVIVSTGPFLTIELNDKNQVNKRDYNNAVSVGTNFEDLVLRIDTKGRIYLRGKLIGQDDELGKIVQTGICK